MISVQLTLGSAEVQLEVRRFSVEEKLSSMFRASIWAVSPDAVLDLASLVGAPGSLHLHEPRVAVAGRQRAWFGVVGFIEQTRTERHGESTYRVELAPSLWLLGHRRNHRLFQHLTVPQMADLLFEEWGIERVWHVDPSRYPRLALKSQHGESDLAFLCRILEEAGISFYFDTDPAAASRLVLSDALHAGASRPGLPIPYTNQPSQIEEHHAFITRVRLAHEVRPGAYLYRDHDFRVPVFPLFAPAIADSPEARYEQYHYEPGAFQTEDNPPGVTPVADDKGAVRHPLPYGVALAERSLQGARADKRHVKFATNVMDLAPGSVFSVGGHPHADLQEGAKLLVTESAITGTIAGGRTATGAAVFASHPYQPRRTHDKPVIAGVESATVVGPPGHEIHTDEHGRVRVQFPWDREGRHDDWSSCWMRVSQGWAGVGFGTIVTPRVGQEVLVAFLGGDPDQPIVVGRVYNATQRVPYPLPACATRSTWKSASLPGGEGFNELMFEDLTGNELVFMQAQKDLRKLVKNNETITIGNNRMKLVMANEIETTGANRSEVTGGSRLEITDGNRATFVGGNDARLVVANNVERTEGDYLCRVGGEEHRVVKGDRRELVGRNSHLHVLGVRNEQIDGCDSLTAGSVQIAVDGNYGLDVKEEIHVRSAKVLVIEATEDLTLKGPGGFIRIDRGGVTIVGKMVKINSGGEPREGSEIEPKLPDDPAEAEVAEPARPVMDDVSKTGIAQ